MPTQPLLGLLDRDDMRHQMADVRNSIRTLLVELVNHGTNLFRRCDATTSYQGDVALGPLSLLYHCIECVDGIQVLVDECCVTPAKPLLRSLMEASLSLAYIATSETERRARQWYVWHLNDRIRQGHKYIDDGPLKKDLQRLRDRWADSERAQYERQVVEVQQEIDGLLEILADARLSDIVAEYNRNPKLHRKHFFAMFNGPNNVEALVREVDEPMHYELFYRPWSGVTHASDLRRVYSSRNGAAVWTPLRYPKEMPHVADMASSFYLLAARHALNVFRPGESTSQWYLREVKQLKDRIRTFVISDSEE